MDIDYLSYELFEAVRNTLETMAFTEVTLFNPNDEKLVEESGDFLWGRVNIESSHNFNAIEFALPTEFATEMAETMFAGMVEIDEKTICDTVAELTNTLTGRFMLNLGEKAGKFVLSVPATGNGMIEAPDNTISCECIVDEIHSIRALLFLED